MSPLVVFVGPRRQNNNQTEGENAGETYLCFPKESG